MDVDVVALICVVVFPTLIFLDLYTSRRRKQQARKTQLRQHPQDEENALILKEGETVWGVIDRGKGKYAFITNDATNSTSYE